MSGRSRSSPAWPPVVVALHRQVERLEDRMWMARDAHELEALRYRLTLSTTQLEQAKRSALAEERGPAAAAPPGRGGRSRRW